MLAYARACFAVGPQMTSISHLATPFHSINLFAFRFASCPASTCFKEEECELRSIIGLIVTLDALMLESQEMYRSQNIFHFLLKVLVLAVKHYKIKFILISVIGTSTLCFRAS